MWKAFINYFSEFKVLKATTKEFWLTNAIQFFDGLSYFSMITILSLYLTDNCGFSDVDSGKWVGFFTLYITAFVFAVGSICDSIGIRRSFFVGIGLLMVSRLALGILPLFVRGEALQYSAATAILVMALGTAFMNPVVSASIRRFTTKENRSTGFNAYYLIMNVGAILAGFAVVDGFRNSLGKLHGNMAIMDFGFLMSLACMICAYFIRRDSNHFISLNRTIKKRRHDAGLFQHVFYRKRPPNLGTHDEKPIRCNGVDAAGIGAACIRSPRNPREEHGGHGHPT